MKKTITKLSAIAIMLFVLQITLTAQPIGSKIQIGTDSHISYWNGVDTWVPVAPGFPGQSLQFVAGIPSWVNNPLGITTTAVTSITGNTAVSGGNILSDGGDKITARGVCWSITPNPTITLTTKTIDGAGIGSFSSNITGLSSGTTYFVRSYATNSVVCTSYGGELSFTTTSPVIDFDGNMYDTVHIGPQIWMKQNLKTTHYNNGTAIDYPGTDNVAWKNNTTGAYSDYDNNPTNSTTYGRLYNWYAVNTGNLCPTDWHVATDLEWADLTNYLGGISIAGGKLKETGITHWSSPNLDATNETGFTALPAGWRGNYGEYVYMFVYSSWWSSTEYGLPTHAFCRGTSCMNGSVTESAYEKNYGFSVRCLKN